MIEELLQESDELVNDESLNELTEEPYNYKRMVQNFSKDADRDLEDSFEDPDYCPKKDSCNEDKFKCKKCGIVFKFRNSLDHHMKTKHVGNCPCNLCQCRFRDSNLLKEHYKKDHSDWEKESNWSMSEQDQTILDVPINKNLEGGTPYCKECNKTFSQQNNLKQHMNTMHGGTTSSKRKHVCNPIVAKTACDKC